MNITSGMRPAGRILSVLVIDDHPLYCSALASALAHEFEGCRIETGTSLHDGLAALGRGFDPDLVILDLRLPDVTGISGFMTLRARVPEVPVLVISALTGSEIVQSLLDSGAAGFIAKDAPVDDLRDALAAIGAGRRYLPRDYRPTRAVREDMACVQELGRRMLDLTPQQARIMKLICAGKPNKQIAYEMQLAEATVKAHITALLRRLGVQNRTQAALLVESADFAPSTQIADARTFLSQ